MNTIDGESRCRKRSKAWDSYIIRTSRRRVAKALGTTNPVGSIDTYTLPRIFEGSWDGIKATGLQASFMWSLVSDLRAHSTEQSKISVSVSPPLRFALFFILPLLLSEKKEKQWRIFILLVCLNVYWIKTKFYLHYLAIVSKTLYICIFIVEDWLHRSLDFHLSKNPNLIQDEQWVYKSNFDTLSQKLYLRNNNRFVSRGTIEWLISLFASPPWVRNDDAHDLPFIAHRHIVMFGEWVMRGDLYLCKYREQRTVNLRKVGFLAWKTSREIEYDTDPDETRIHKRDCNETSARNARNFSLMIALVDGASSTRADQALSPGVLWRTSELTIDEYNIPFRTFMAR